MEEYEVQNLLSPSPPVISLSTAGWRNESGEHHLIQKQDQNSEDFAWRLDPTVRAVMIVFETYQKNLESLNSQGTFLMS